MAEGSSCSSGVARDGRPGAAAYSTAKAALDGLRASLKGEAGAAGALVNIVSPGFTVTENNLARFSDGVRESVRERTPSRQLSVPDDVAEAVLLLGVPCERQHHRRMRPRGRRDRLATCVRTVRRPGVVEQLPPPADQPVLPGDENSRYRGLGGGRWLTGLPGELAVRGAAAARDYHRALHAAGAGRGGRGGVSRASRSTTGARFSYSAWQAGQELRWRRIAAQACAPRAPTR